MDTDNTDNPDKRETKRVVGCWSDGVVAPYLFSVWGAQPPRLHRSAPRRPDRVFGEGAEHYTRGARPPNAQYIQRLRYRSAPVHGRTTRPIRPLTSEFWSRLNRSDNAVFFSAKSHKMDRLSKHQGQGAFKDRRKSRSCRGNKPFSLPRIVVSVPSGGSPDGTGGSPVLPGNYFPNTL